MRKQAIPSPADFALLPRSPKNTSPVPGLTSLYHNPERGNYGDARYPGNCSGNLIRDLLRYYMPREVLDPMCGSGTCGDVCRELGLEYRSTDLKETMFGSFDACDPASYSMLLPYQFVWLHPPYWRQKHYSDDPHDLCNARTLDAFLTRYEQLLTNCRNILEPGGHMAILMGDYCDRAVGFVPLTFHTKRIAFDLGLKQSCTDIIRFSHGASSSWKTYRSRFIPGLHDVCMVFEKPKE